MESGEGPSPPISRARYVLLLAEGFNGGNIEAEGGNDDEVKDEAKDVGNDDDGNVDEGKDDVYGILIPRFIPCAGDSTVPGMISGLLVNAVCNGSVSQVGCRVFCSSSIR